MYVSTTLQPLDQLRRLVVLQRVLGHLKLTHLGQQKLTHPADVAAAGRLARTS
jgi:hypothetical protein